MLLPFSGKLLGTFMFSRKMSKPSASFFHRSLPNTRDTDERTRLCVECCHCFHVFGSFCNLYFISPFTTTAPMAPTNRGFFVLQGSKGDPGSPGKPLHGAIKIGDTGIKCAKHTAGTIRYNAAQHALQFCDGSAWSMMIASWKGHVNFNPGRHCLDILNSGENPSPPQGLKK